jgi:hypothetical protein
MPLTVRGWLQQPSPEAAMRPSPTMEELLPMLAVDQKP